MNEEMRRLLAQANQQNQSQAPQPKQAGVGSFLLGLLPGGSLIDKGIRGEQITGGDVAMEAALSLVPFGLGKVAKGIKGASKLSRGADALGGASRTTARPGMMSRMGMGLEDKGNRLLGTQANLTRAEGRKIGAIPSDVLGALNKRTGLTKMDDMASVAKGVTGQDGAFSELTRNAIGNAPGVDIGDLRRIGDDLLTNKAPLITGQQKKNILESVKNSGVAVRGGSAGSLSPLANPLDALDVSKNFRAMASDIGKGATVSAKDKQLAGVYNDLASHIETTLYKAPGVSEGLKLAAPDRARDLLAAAANAPTKAQANAYKRLAKEVGEIKDVKSLRTAQKDFVNLSKIDDATARAASGAGAQLGDQAQGLGKLVQRPTNMLALPLNAATPAVAGMMTKGGRILQGMGGQAVEQGGRSMAGSAARFLAPQAGVRVGADILGLRAGEQAAGAIDPMTGLPTGQADQMIPPGAGGMPGMDGITDMGAAGALGGADQGAGSIYTRDAVAQDIQKDLAATGGANMEKYMKLYEFLNPEESAGGAKANANTQKSLAQSANADNTLSQLEGLLQQAGGAGGPVGGNISSFFGGLGLNNDVKTYNDLTSGSVTQIAKALGETGAMSDSDRIAYMNLLPKVTDTPQVAAAKFAALRERMATSQQSALQYGAGSGIEDALAAGGF